MAMRIVPTVKAVRAMVITHAGRSRPSSKPVVTEASPPEMATGQPHAAVCTGVAPRSSS